MEEMNEAKEQREQTETLPEGSLIAGRYEIIRCIGIGGFGMIYLCEDRELHCKVAVKEYFPRQWAEREGVYVSVKSSSTVDAFRFGMQSFRREAEIMSQFAQTPHVVAYYDILEANDTVYLVMEYIDGISVGRMLRERKYRPYPLKKAAEILLPALEGLEGMHEKSIIHSDISPGNIVCSREGEICLIDLGAAKNYKEKIPVLSAGFLKPDYAAPEQYRTARDGVPREEGPWTDVYGAGATLYYLLMGRKPVDAVSRLKGGKLKGRGRWMKLIRRAMALDYRERIPSVREFSAGIRRLIR